MARKKWKPPRDRMPSRTLFDPDFHKHIPLEREWSYETVVSSLLWNDDRRFYDQELGIFDDIIESEQQLCGDSDGSNGALAGPLVVKVGKARQRNLATVGKSYFELPSWVEADNLKFQASHASGILLFEKHAVFQKLFEAKAWRGLNLILACGGGIPRWRMRRVLHRLSNQFQIPVYVLTDNDTWGYYFFSVLKRGMMAPHESCPQLAVKDVRFLGMRANEYMQCGTRKECMIRWRRRWDLRLSFMRKYRCFRSKAWRREFDSFKKQNGKTEMEVLCWRLGVSRVVDDYLLPKLINKDWLT